MHPDGQTFRAAGRDGESLLTRQLAALRDALEHEVRALALGTDALAAPLAQWIRRGSLRRAALLYALGNAMGTPENWLLPPAVAVELAHAATLLHDDLLDGDTIRRGMPALWKQTAPHPAVLSGDLLLCRALECLARSTRRDLLPVFVRALSRVCRGEIRQDFAVSSTPTAEKTAPFFAFAALAAAPADASPALVRALARTGLRLGAAFQAQDDLADATPPSPTPPRQQFDASLCAPLDAWPHCADAIRCWIEVFL